MYTYIQHRICKAADAYTNMEARVFQLKWIPRDRFMQAVAVVDGDATVIQGPVTMVDWKKDQRYNVDGLVAALKSVPIDAYDIDFTICSDPNAYVHVVADPVSKKEYIKRFIAVTNKVPALLQWLYDFRKEILGSTKV